jgi:hypothetical protein
MMRPDKIVMKISALEAARDTVNEQINTLGNFYSHPQIKVWRRRRAKIQRMLRYYKALLNKKAA